MGAAHSTSSPLVEVSAPGGRVLVPPYTAFTVHPPKHNDPVYRHVRGARPRRRPRADYEILEDQFESENEFSMEGMGRGRGGGYGGRMGGGMGKARGGPMFHEMDGRPRSAPEMPMGQYSRMRSPRMAMPGMGLGGIGGPGGMGPGGMGGMGGPGMGNMGGIAQAGIGPGGMPDLPPGYTSMQSIPRYSGAPGGGMPGANPHGYPAPPPSPPSSTGAPTEKPTRRPSRRPLGANERIPMGAYARAERSPKLTRTRTEPTTADRLNRGQSESRRVGPSGNEWIKGDNFLDACVCTTSCTCRKGYRVLYHSRDDPVGSDSDSLAQTRYGSGEIRYILKTQLGRDCGDHSGCKKSESESENEGESKKGKKREKKKRTEQFEGFKEDLLEALDEKFDAIKKARSSKAPSVSSPRPPFAGLSARPNPFGTSDPNRMDPLMAQKLGMGGMGMGGNPYTMGMPGMGKMPPGMEDPIRGQSMYPGQMPIGAMGGVNYKDDVSMVDMEAMGMGNPYLAASMKGKGMQSRFMSPSRRKPGGPGEMEMDPMAFYSRGPGMGGRGGMLGGRGLRNAGRQRCPAFGSDDFDLGPRRSGMNKRRNSGADSFGNKGGGGLGADDEDGPIATTHRVGSTGRRNQGRTSDRDRGRQPRADTDDDDGY